METIEERPVSDTGDAERIDPTDADSDRGHDSEVDARLERPELFVRTEEEARKVIEALGAWIENLPAADYDGERRADLCLAVGHRVQAWWPVDYGHPCELVEGVVVIDTQLGKSGEAGETEWYCDECGDVAAPPEEDYR